MISESVKSPPSILRWKSSTQNQTTKASMWKKKNENNNSKMNSFERQEHRSEPISTWQARFLVVFFEWRILTLLTNRNVALIIQSQLVSKIERIVVCQRAPNVDYSTVVFAFDFCIVSKGNWLWKPANITVENNGATVYVGSSMTVHKLTFFVEWLQILIE